MEISVQKTRAIEDGKHDGKIVDVSYRTKPYEYTDLHIEMDGGIVLKAGYPTFICDTSKLGELLKRFGIVIIEGQSADPDDLKSRPCTFVTTTSGKFANIVPESVMPI